eukprot:gene46411-64831_t
MPKGSHGGEAPQRATARAANARPAPNTAPAAAGTPARCAQLGAPTPRTMHCSPPTTTAAVAPVAAVAAPTLRAVAMGAAAGGADAADGGTRRLRLRWGA